MESRTASRRRVVYEFCDDCWSRARELDAENPTPDGKIFDPVTRTTRDCSCRAGAISVARWRIIEREIPRKLRGASLDRSPLFNLPPSLKQLLADYVAELAATVEDGDEPRQGLWLMGPVGTGKSAAAAWIAREAHNMGLRVSWWSLSRLLSHLREGYSEHAEFTPQQLIDQLVAGAQLVVLDDVGVPRATPWALEALHDLLDGFYLAERPVIATSDLDEHEFDARYEERLGSRLSELCGRPVRFEGHDLRRPHLSPPEIEPSIAARASDSRQAKDIN